MRNKTIHPPWLCVIIIQAFSLQYHRRIAIGDIDELYDQIRQDSGKKIANCWYWRQTIKSIPYLIHNLTYWSVAMFKNYFKLTVRNLIKNRLFTTINILGLSVGMACFLLISLWIQDELSHDQFHINKDNLYLLTIKHPNDILDYNVPYALAPVLASEFPEILKYTRIYEYGNLTTCSFKYQPDDQNRVMYYEEKIILVDPAFFEMFSFPFVHGNPETAMENQAGLVISEKTAQKYFGQENPLGKTLTFNNRVELVVTGVVRVPSNSHIQFDFLASLNDRMGNDWNWRDPSYVQLDENCAVKDLKEKIAGSLNKHYPNPINGIFEVGLLPYTKVYLGFGRMTYVRIFSVIAIFILIIACINYMNLSTACSSNRAKEVGLRKVVGADRKQLIFQFLGESTILSVLSMILALILAQIFLPTLNTLTSKQLTFFPGNTTPIILLSMGLVAVIGLLSGSYPALFLTSVRPIDTLRTFLSFRSHKSIFRVISVVGQFTISVLLIACTIVVFKQLDYIQKRPLGLTTDSILKIKINEALGRNLNNLKNDLLMNPNILSVTASQAVPYDEDYKTSGVEWDKKDPDLAPVIRYSITDFDYIETFELQILEGRSFSLDFPGDINNFVINEEAVKYMEMENPIGQRLRFWGNTGTIIGVVKNFHHVSLHKEILPHVFTINPNFLNWFRFIYVKIHASNVSETIEAIEASALKHAPDYPFEYSFLDQGLDNLYQAEQKLGKIFGYFACIAIFISCLGIFGLSAYTGEQRIKEIGIRKVLGASVSGIVILLSREFSKWIFLAILISWPVAWYFMDRWLQNFAYRTSINWLVFLSSGLLAFAIALLTVSYQAIKAAQSNPVDSLRIE